MAIKLLSKDEIAKAREIDKTKEIEEGLKISRKVDSLRELRLAEEQALNNWRKECLASIQEEINEINEKKSVLVADVKALEEKAKKELSKTDKKRLEDLEKYLESQRAEIKKKSEELDLKEIDIALTIKESNDSLVRAQTHEETALRLHVQAEKESEETQQKLIEAQNTEANTLRFKESIEQALLLREQDIERKEKEFMIEKEDNIKISRENAQEKLQLADMRRTLERALERLRKNRLA